MNLSELLMLLLLFFCNFHYPFLSNNTIVFKLSFSYESGKYLGGGGGTPGAPKVKPIKLLFFGNGTASQVPHRQPISVEPTGAHHVK